MPTRIEKGLAHDALVHRIARKLNTTNASLHDDLVQVGRMAVLQGRESYDPAHPDAPSEHSWVSWYIYRDILRYLRREVQQVGEHQDIDDLLDLDDVDELMDYDAPEKLEELYDAFHMLEGMPEPEQVAVALHVFEDLSYAEIGERMSLNKQAVYRLVTQGMRLLQEKFS